MVEQLVSEGPAIKFFKKNLKNLNLDICIFTQGLNVKQVFYCYIVIILVFILDSFLA